MLKEDDVELAKAMNIGTVCHSMEATKAQLPVIMTRSETDSVTIYELHNKCKSETVRPSRFSV